MGIEIYKRDDSMPPFHIAWSCSERARDEYGLWARVNGYWPSEDPACLVPSPLSNSSGEIIEGHLGLYYPRKSEEKADRPRLRIFGSDPPFGPTFYFDYDTCALQGINTTETRASLGKQYCPTIESIGFDGARLLRVPETTRTISYGAVAWISPAGEIEVLAEGDDIYDPDQLGHSLGLPSVLRRIRFLRSSEPTFMRRRRVPTYVVVVIGENRGAARSVSVYETCGNRSRSWNWVPGVDGGAGRWEPDEWR